MNADNNPAYHSNNDTARPYPDRTPPTPPPRTRTGLFTNLEEEYRPLDSSPALWDVTDLLLKSPARLIHAIVQGRYAAILMPLFIVLCVSLLAYGLVMGSFSGGHQLWAVPLKLLFGVLVCGLICLPSLYIFTSLSGSDLPFRCVAGLLCMMLTLTSVLLLGLAPVAWIFSQSSGTLAFMGVLHLLFWTIAAHIGLQLLRRSFEMLTRRRMAAVGIWLIVFAAVTLQMSTVLRPLIGDYHRPLFQEKKFFLAHWTETLQRKSR